MGKREGTNIIITYYRSTPIEQVASLIGLEYGSPTGQVGSLLGRDSERPSNLHLSDIQVSLSFFFLNYHSDFMLCCWQRDFNILALDGKVCFIIFVLTVLHLVPSVEYRDCYTLGSHSATKLHPNPIPFQLGRKLCSKLIHVDIFPTKARRVSPLYVPV